MLYHNTNNVYKVSYLINKRKYVTYTSDINYTKCNISMYSKINDIKYNIVSFDDQLCDCTIRFFSMIFVFKNTKRKDVIDRIKRKLKLNIFNRFDIISNKAINEYRSKDIHVRIIMR